MNKIETLGYTLKALRDAGYLAIRCFTKYSENDKRKWTIIIAPNSSSIFVTCYKQCDGVNGAILDISDGGDKFKKPLIINTKSVIDLVSILEEVDVETCDTNSMFFKGNFDKTSDKFKL